ncbi:hypothetical protein D3C87_1529660 [compost metagenome]
MPRLRVNGQLQALAAGLAQGVGQIFQTFAFAHRITFAANHQQRQAGINLSEIGRFADLLQPAEQIDPHLIGAAIAAERVVGVQIDFRRVAAEPVETRARRFELFVE